MSNMTDTAALADVLAAFESEFPGADWSVSRTTGAIVLRNFEVVAQSWLSDPAAALRACADQLRADHERQRRDNEHTALLDAEYGPARSQFDV